MSLDLFRVMGGLGIQTDNLTSSVHILTGTATPGGDSGVQDAAPRGSLYLRSDAATDGQQLYWKFTTVNNSSADWKVAADKSYVDAAVQGLSWREPARVLDATLYADSSAFPLTGIIDSVSLNDGDRVLFTNVTTSTEENVWIWNAGSPASWVEDSNSETDGDAIFIREGSAADNQWVYDGTAWVQFGTTSSGAELGFIRSFVGKTGPGAENPTYSSTNAVTQSSNLETAIGALDATLGDGEITNDGGNYALSDDLSWAVSGTLSTSAALNQLNAAIGNRTYTEDNVVTDGQTIALSINALDVAIGALQDQESEFSGNNVAAVSGVTLDTIPLASATQVKWLVQVREAATPANRRSLEVHAFNDGSSLVDHTEYGVLVLGSAIAAFDINVDINASDMRLRLTATNNVDYVVKRIAYSAF